jgi:putative transposase
MRTYKRIKVGGATYFFTVNLAERSGSGLLTTYVENLRSAVQTVKRAHPFAIDAMVVLPDHLHALWTLPADDHDYATRWRLIKGYFSKALPPQENVSASRLRKGERGIWQRRYWEHLIRDELDLHRHLDYIHFNPVKHGYVSHPADWPHSSFLRFVEGGYYPLNWAASEEVRNMSGVSE